MEIVALFAGLPVSGYRSHLILPTFANVSWTCDPSNFTHHVSCDSILTRLLLAFVVLFYLLISAQSETHHNIKSCLITLVKDHVCMYAQHNFKNMIRIIILPKLFLS